MCAYTIYAICEVKCSPIVVINVNEYRNADAYDHLCVVTVVGTPVCWNLDVRTARSNLSCAADGNGLKMLRQPCASNAASKPTTDTYLKLLHLLRGQSRPILLVQNVQVLRYRPQTFDRSERVQKRNEINPTPDTRYNSTHTQRVVRNFRQALKIGW